MTIIGSAYVDIRAITEHLEADIKKALATLPDKIDVQVNADTTAAESQIDLLVEWGNIHKIDVAVDADTVGAEVHVAEAVAAISHEEVSIQVDADTVGAAAHVDSFIHDESGRDINVPVDVDEAAAITKMAALRAKLDAIAGLKPITIPVAVGNGKGPIGDIENALRATGSELDKANLRLTVFGEAMKTAGGHAATSGTNIQTFLSKLSGFGGLVDLTKAFVQLKINLGEEVPAIAMTAERIGTMASAALFAAGNILSLGSSLVQLAGLGAALPGVFVGFEIALKLTSIAFSDMKKAVPDLAKEMQNLKNMISQDFWAKARTGLMDLIGPTSVLREELVKTSGTVGAFWGTMFEGMSKGSFAKAMAGDFNNLNEGIKVITNSSSTFLHIFQTLGEFGSAYIPKLAQGLVDVSARFDAFLTKANADGTLKRWVDNGVTSFHGLISVVENTSAVIGGLMKAATDAGGASLGILGAAMEHFAAVIKEPAVQTALVNLFSGANTMIKETVTGLSSFLGAIGWLSPALKNVETNVGIAIQSILILFGKIIANPAVFKGIQDLFRGIVEGLQAFDQATGPIGDKLGIFMTIVGEVAASLGNVFANAAAKVLPVVKELLQGIEPLIKPLGELTMAFTDALAPALDELIKAGFPPLIALMTGAVIPALKELIPVVGTVLPPLMALLGDTIRKLAPIFQDLIQHITPIVEKLIEVASKAIPAVLAVIVPLADGFEKVVKALLPIVDAVLDFVDGMLKSKVGTELLIGAVALVIGTIGTFNLILGISKGVVAAATFATGAYNTVMEAGRIIMELWADRSKVAAAATAIFNAVMDANPISLVVIGIAALIAGIVLLIANWDKVTKAVSDFVNTSGLGEWVNQTVGMFADFGKNTIGMFVDFFNNTIGMFRDFGNNAGKAITGFTDNTRGMFQDFFRNTVGMVTDFVKNTIGMFTDFGKNVQKTIDDFIKNFTNGWRGFWQDPIGEVHKFINSVVDFFTGLHDKVQNALIKFFIDTVNSFVKWEADVIATVARWVSDFVKGIDKFDSDTRGMFRDFFNNTVGMFKDFFRNTDGMFTDFWNSVPKAMERFRDSAGRIIGDFVKNTMGMFKDFDNNTRGMFNDFFGGIQGMWNDFWGKNLPNAINRFNSDTNGMFNDFVSNTIGMFADFFGNIGNAWNGFVNGIVGMVTDWTNNLISMFVGYYAQTTGETRAFLDGFIGAIGGWANQTIGMFSDFWNNTVGMFQDMWNNVGNAVNDGLARLGGWFSGVGSTILNAIGDPGSLLVNAGNNIMNGFLGGLKDAWKGVTDFVGGIGDWIAQHKGPEAYDKALLIPHGGWIMGGLQKGIENSMGSLKHTLTGVTDLISDTMNTSVAVNVSGNARSSNPNIFAQAAGTSTDPFATASGMGYGQARTVVTPTVNVYPSAPLNEKQVGQMAATELFWNFTNR